MTRRANAALQKAAKAVAVGPENLDAAAQDLSAAFADDELFNWVLRDDDRRGGARLALFRLMLEGLGGGSSVVARPAEGGAAIVWLTSETLGHNSWIRELKALPTLLAATGLARFRRMSAMRAAMDANHPMDRQHLYLWFLGVRPELQGRGIGSRLLRAGLERVDGRGMPAFLETAKERNLGFYRAHGFEVTGDYQITPTSPRVWTLWREPAC